jgi:hypothetical protein
MAEEQTEWGTSSGLLEKCTGTIAEAWFGKNEQAEGPNADRVYLFWRLINLESEEGYDEWVARLSIGNGWEPVDGGARVVREDGGNKPFNNSTDYGKVINRVLGANGGKEGKAFEGQFNGAFDVLKSKGNQYQADVWVGMRFEFDTEEFSSTINGEDVTWSRLLPQKYVGADGRTGGAGGDAQSATATEAPAQNGAGSLESQLVAIAKEASSHSEFVERALSVDGITDDGALLAKVADDSDNGIYAQAQA